ncbi:MAG: hypothetical protein ACKO3V_14190 [Pirellula sp.]
MNAYLFKELRETARWLPLAWLIFAGLLYVALPQMSYLYLTQGLADRLVFQTAIGGSLVAFGLGLAQFMLDQRSSARAFLVHRSLTPSQLFRGKLLVGLGIYALGVGGPLMLLTLYLSWISDRFPCTPFQTIPAWVISIFCTAFYFAACLVSCSNARWFGTRCFPIVGSILIVSGACVILAPELLWIVALILCLPAFGLIAMIRAASESFVFASSAPSPTANVPIGWERRFILTITSIAIVAAIGGTFRSLLTQQSRTLYNYYDLKIDPSGDPNLVVYQNTPDINEPRKLVQSIRYTMENGQLLSEESTKPNTKLNDRSCYFINRPKGYAELNFQWNPTPLGQRLGQSYFQMNNGFVHSYGSSFQGWRLDHVIGANGMTENGQYPSEPFSGRVRAIIDYENHANGSKPENPSTNAIPRLHIVDGDGIVEIELDKKQVRRIGELPRSQLGTDYSSFFLGHQAPRYLFFFLDQQIHVYASTARQADIESVQDELPTYKFDSKIDVPSEFKSDVFQFWFGATGHYTFFENMLIQVENEPKRPGYRIASSSSGNSKLKSYEFPIPKSLITTEVSPIGIGLLGAIVPPVAMFAYAVFLPFSGVFTYPYYSIPDHIGWLVGALFLQIAIAMILAYLAAQQRGLSARSRTLWLILSALLGPASSLAILAIYPECFREPCPRCNKRRRVENELCEHCGEAWDKPDEEGIEVIETSSNAINQAVLA